jgi:hypothetical protein
MTSLRTVGLMETERDDPKTTRRQTERTGRPPQCGGAVYGLGLIGALVWFWQQADGVGEHVVGVLKAIVWPAFLVYEAFKGLGG